MGFIIDNPEPPTAWEGLSSSLGSLGNLYFQKKMAEMERKKNFEDEIQLLREKSRIEQESPLFKAEQRAKVLGIASQMNIDPREASSMIGYNPDELFQPAQASSILPQPMEKPVFGGGVQLPAQPKLGGQSNLMVKDYEQKMGRLQPKNIIDVDAMTQEKTLEKAVSEAVPAIQKANTLDAYVDNIESMWLKTNPREKGSLALPVFGAMDWLKAQTQETEEDINTKAYIDLVNATRALPARAFGDVGNLSEYEQKAVKGGLASAIFDIKKTGKLKFDNLRKIVADIKKARKQGMKLEEYQTKTVPVFGSAGQKQGSIRVVAPDGRTGTIPANQLEEALSSGYRKYGN